MLPSTIRISERENVKRLKRRLFEFWGDKDWFVRVQLCACSSACRALTAHACKKLSDKREARRLQKAQRRTNCERDERRQQTDASKSSDRRFLLSQ